MTPPHKVTEAGESTEGWAIRQPGFLGSIRQHTHCARCGDPLPAQPHSEPRHYGYAGKGFMNVICNPCHEELP
jgi:hypothetical protein